MNDPEWASETEYTVTTIAIEEDRSVILTDGWRIVKVLEASKGIMANPLVWHLTVLLECERESTDE